MPNIVLLNPKRKYQLLKKADVGGISPPPPTAVFKVDIYYMYIRVIQGLKKLILYI